MTKPTKTEVQIISLALILALVTLAVFWGSSQMRAPETTFNQSSLTSPENTATSNILANPIISEPSNIAPLGLANLLKPTTVRALILGGSIAESSGASDPDLASWPALVSHDLAIEYLGNIQWLLRTSSTASINDALKFVPAATPDTGLIIVCLGRHDSGKLRRTEFKTNYEQLIVELQAQSPQADIFLVIEPPVEDLVANNEFALYRQIILDLGQRHQLQVIDQWTSFINDPAPLANLLADGVNPNDLGYRVFADTVLKSFNDFLALKA